MRTHADIIRDVGVEEVLSRTKLPLSVHTVRSWLQRDAIPGEYWAAIQGADLATLEELAGAAAVRKGLEPARAA